jgi:adenosine deaminase
VDQDANPDRDACRVEVRYLAWAWRGLPPAQAFRSLVLAFAIADRDRRFAGVNIVEPEDGAISLRDYDLHMAMFRFLEAKYPNVRRSLHAGELARGLVPPAALRDHIRKAVEVGGAQRIGHGVDIAYEDDARATLARMARDRIAVEINLTSNDVILGVRGAEHPLGLYRLAGVPVVLSTDDEGDLRTDLTQEYVRAAREHGLRYLELKGIARASLEYAFLPGASLWRDGEVGRRVEPCASGLAAPGCQALVRQSERARLQADLEQRFAAFEAAIVGQPF